VGFSTVIAGQILTGEPPSLSISAYTHPRQKTLEINTPNRMPLAK